MALSMAVRRLVVVVAILFALAAGAVSSAQSDRSVNIEAASREIADIRVQVDAETLEDPEALEVQLRELRDDSRSRLSAIERELASNRSQLDLLGPAPGENDPPESEIIAEERSTLEGRRAQLNGQRTRVLANIYESGELLARISGAKVGALYKSLVTRSASPLAPAVWADAWRSASEVSGRVGRYFTNWSNNKQGSGDYSPALIGVIVAIIGSFLMFVPVSRWVSSTFSDQVEKRKPTPARRIFVAGPHRSRRHWRAYYY